MLRKGHGGLYKAPTKKKESEGLRGEGDQIKSTVVEYKQNCLYMLSTFWSLLWWGRIT